MIDWNPLIAALSAVLGALAVALPLWLRSQAALNEARAAALLARKADDRAAAAEGTAEAALGAAQSLGAALGGTRPPEQGEW